MIKLNLPPYRLSVNFRLVKRRSFSWKRVLKRSLRQVQSIESRDVRLFIRRVFAHKNVKKVLGTNLTLMLVATSFIPTHELVNDEAESPIITENQTVLKTERSIQFPVESIKITQGYRLFHPGIDLDGLTGDIIRPIKSGRVTEVSRSRFSYGNAVIVDHGNEITSLYAHLSEIDVEPDQEVTTGTIIGKMGASGHAYGDHLHLEIRDHGRPVNPTSVLSR